MHNLPPTPFLFLRHGETDWNAEQRVMGRQNVSLNDQGITQATDAAAILKEYSISHCFHSPLKRATQTAEIICNTLDIALTPENNLKECSWGEAEGSIIPSSPVTLFLAEGNVPLGGEPIQDFMNRIQQSMQTILNHNTLPLIVAHGGVYWALQHITGCIGEDIHNCTPCLFTPGEEGNSPWNIDILGK